ncbi:MAG: YraN family protein [Halieaceae bacterium]|nr:YraN family protein [Halieaceae bacterium]MCP5204771.1 YraN family protein [Pseudomonadales bacterium]
MKSLGDDYEERAALWLQRQGLRVLARNFRARTGEIDLIARDGRHLVFCEVRARSNRYYCSAAGSVDQAKQRRLLRTAQVFLQRHPALANLPCRFDVIAFEPRQSGSDLDIRWIAGAFTA